MKHRVLLVSRGASRYASFRGLVEWELVDRAIEVFVEELARLSDPREALERASSKVEGLVVYP
jgi:hypothetical protein